MNATIRTKEKTEKTEYAMTVDAGNGEQDLRTELSFERSKGTFKITATITTKHVSLHYEATNEAILSDVTELLRKSIGHAISERLSWLSANEGGNPNQGKLFGDNPPEEEGEPVVIVKKKKKGVQVEEEGPDDIGF